MIEKLSYFMMEGPSAVITVRKDRRFTKNSVRTLFIPKASSRKRKVRYMGKIFTVYRGGNIFLNQHKVKLECTKCGAPDGIKPGVPMGNVECIGCRTGTGTCGICKKNRNDCSC